MITVTSKYGKTYTYDDDRSEYQKAYHRKYYRSKRKKPVMTPAQRKVAAKLAQSKYCKKKGMPKGDGWAVRRYLCPICNRKGLYLKYQHIATHHGMGCMYAKCPSNLPNAPAKMDFSLIVAANPELAESRPEYKLKIA